MANAFTSKLIRQVSSLAIRRAEQATLAALSLLALLTMSLAPLGQSPKMAKPLAPPRFVLDPNTASESELLLLPQVGPSLAAAILAERKQGPFESPADVGRTRGIGDKTLQKLLPHLQITPSKFHPENQ